MASDLFSDEKIHGYSTALYKTRCNWYRQYSKVLLTTPMQDMLPSTDILPIGCSY